MTQGDTDRESARASFRVHPDETDACSVKSHEVLVQWIVRPDRGLASGGSMPRDHQ
jgi:hypothetical protein